MKHENIFITWTLKVICYCVHRELTHLGYLLTVFCAHHLLNYASLNLEGQSSDLSYIRTCTSRQCDPFLLSTMAVPCPRHYSVSRKALASIRWQLLCLCSHQQSCQTKYNLCVLPMDCWLFITLTNSLKFPSNLSGTEHSVTIVMILPL